MSNSEHNVDMDDSTMNESEQESVENTEASPNEKPMQTRPVRVKCLKAT